MACEKWKKQPDTVAFGKYLYSVMHSTFKVAAKLFYMAYITNTIYQSMDNFVVDNTRLSWQESIGSRNKLSTVHMNTKEVDLKNKGRKKLQEKYIDLHNLIIVLAY